MSEGRWRITVTAPDWGEDHLTLDAVVAFVDDELSAGPRERATRHAAGCGECAAQVVAQTQARVALRTAAGPQLPSSLLSSLRSIPQHAELPAAPADLAVGEDGQFVTRVRPERPERSAGRTRSATLPARRPASTGTVEAAEQAAPAGLDRRTPADHGRRRPVSRGLKLGTGVAVSGLALGALAFGAAGAAGPSNPAPPTERGVLGGSVLGPGTVDARLRVGSQSSRGEVADEPGADGFGPLRSIW